MGKYALYLGENYAIHGTNNNFGIGLRVTRGCIRLRTQDIEYLFNLVPIGTKVQFINQPIKYTMETNGIQYLEIHTPLSTNDTNTPTNLEQEIISYIKKYKKNASNTITNINYKIIKKVIQEKSGIPIKISESR